MRRLLECVNLSAWGFRAMGKSHVLDILAISTVHGNVRYIAHVLVVSNS